MLGKKASLDTLKRIEMIWSIFPHHEGIKLEIIIMKKYETFPNILKLSKCFYKTYGLKKS